MKVSGVLGKLNGKAGGFVFSTVAGQTIGREYNPNVANPSTAKQVDQRAKMKLMSQLAAVMAPVIVIPKEGLKSSRNLFIKRNFESAVATSGVAQITYENIQLTNGNAGLPAIHIVRSQAEGVKVDLSERCDAAVTRVVYILYSKTSEQTLQYVASIIVSEAGAEGKFPGVLPYTTGDICVFAYGMKDLNAKATATYADYNVQNGEDIASLAMSRKLSLSDYQFTKTRGTTLFANESESTSVPDGSARVFVTAVGNGQVQGAGIFTIGSQVSVSATPDSGWVFKGWKLQGGNSYISTSANYSFTLEAQTDLLAIFEENDDMGDGD